MTPEQKGPIEKTGRMVGVRIVFLDRQQPFFRVMLQLHKEPNRSTCDLSYYFSFI